MGESFKKFKRKHIKEAIIKSVVAGASCGLFVACVALLALKINLIELHWAFYILIGIAVAGACGTGLFFIIRPDDLTTAKRLDREYGLHEKAQTMVEFAGGDDEILKLQREDTSEILKNLPKPRFTVAGAWKYFISARIWQYAICAVCAVVMAGVALGLNFTAIDDGSGTANGDTGNGDKVFVYDLYKQAAMADLILDVRESSLNEQTVKPAYINVLEQLDRELRTVTDDKVMEDYVLAAVELLDGITETANTYGKICEELKNDNKDLASAIKKSVAVYKTYAKQINSLRFIKALELELGDLISEVLQEPLSGIAESLKLADDKDDGGKLNSFINSLTEALNASGVSEDDALYTQVNNLRTNLREVYNKVGKGYGIGTLNTQISSYIDDFKNGLLPVLKEQTYNRIMDYFVRVKLGGIFTVTLPALDEDEEEAPDVSDDGSDGEGSGGEGEGGGSSGGGYGEGGEIYGSNDLIYDPDTDAKVEYGTVLDEYYQKFFERILNGDFSYVSEYFSILFGGIDEN